MMVKKGGGGGGGVREVEEIQSSMLNTEHKGKSP